MDEIKVTSDKLKETVKNIIHEGNVRRVIVRNAEPTEISMSSRL